MSKPSIKPWTHRVSRQLRYASAKFDGIFCHVFRQHGRLIVHSSTPTDITESVARASAAGNKWYQSLDARKIDVRLYGELCAPGETSSYVSHALAEAKALSLIVFGVPSMTTGEPLEVVQREMVGIGMQFAPFHVVQDRDFGKFLATHRVPGYAEGWIGSNGNLLDMYKFKTVKTIDCVVLGFEPGQGKYSSKIGAMSVGVYDGSRMVEIASCSGMTDAQRNAMSAADVGRVVEIAYQNIGAQGRLRHPRFKCWRNDKPERECVLDQDPDLVRAHGECIGTQEGGG